MKRLVEFDSAVGPVLVEIDITDTPGITPAARPGELIAKASQTLEQALERIVPVIGIMISKVHSIARLPDEVAIEFGVKMGAEVGAIVAASNAEANFKLALKWRHEPH